MAANNGDGPSFFARYIDGPEKEWPRQAKEAIEQQHKSADLVSQWVQEANAKIFLANILTNGPTLVTAIEEQGAAHGFSKKQLEYAKKQINVVAFKKRGVFGGPWFWALTGHTPDLALAKKGDDRYIRYLRDLSKNLGFRLQPIDKYPRPPTNEKDHKDDGQK
jgi:hypothetical protein